MEHNKKIPRIKSKFEKLSIFLANEYIFEFLNPRERFLLSFINRKIKKISKNYLDEIKRTPNLQYLQVHEVENKSGKEFLLYKNYESKINDIIIQNDTPAHSYLTYSMVHMLWKKDNCTLVSCSADKTVKVWNLLNNKLIHEFKDVLGDWIYQLIQIISIDNDYTVISGNGDGYFNVYDILKLNLVKSIKKFRGSRIYSMCQFIFEINQSTLLSSSGCELIVWNYIDENVYYKLTLPDVVVSVRQIISDWDKYNLYSNKYFEEKKNNEKNVNFDHLIIIALNGFKKEIQYYDLKNNDLISSHKIGEENPFNQIIGVQLNQIKFLNENMIKNKHVKIIIGFQNDVFIYDLNKNFLLLMKFELNTRIHVMEQIFHYKNQLLFMIGHTQGKITLITIDENFKSNNKSILSTGRGDLYSIKQLYGFINEKVIAFGDSGGRITYYKTCHFGDKNKNSSIDFCLIL